MTNPDSGQIIIEIKPELSELTDVRHALSATLNRYKLSEEKIDNVLLLASEHMSNVVRHSPLASHLKVTIAQENQQSILRLFDDGEPINSLLACSDDISEINLDGELQTSGMGIPLIKALFPDYIYSQRVINGIPYNVMEVAVSTIKALPTVVIIDDDITTLALIEAYLSSDYNVSAFSQSQEALDYILSTPPCIVISDIKMPLLDGFELKRVLGKHTQTNTVPFIFLTGQPEDNTHESAADLSVDDYLEKPVNKQTLLQTLKRILNRSNDIKQSINAELERTVTNSLWSPLPASFAGINIDSSFEVASRGGGDFIFFDQRADSVLILLGDVMGHGDQAKFFSHAMAGYVHGLFIAQPKELSPSALLNKCSEAINQSPVLAKTLITCLAIEIKSTGTITLASAGHPYPWLIAKSSSGNLIEVEDIKVEGMLLGLTEHADYQEQTLSINQDQTLICYTDGLTECMQGSKKADQALLVKQRIINQSTQPHRTASNILSGLKLADFHQPIDDITIITLTQEK